MDFTERLDLYLEGGMITENDVKDVNAIIDLFKEKYGIVLEEENAGTFVAHICAAFGRNMTKEEVEPLPEEVENELKGLPTYGKSLEILENIMGAINNPLNDVERDYALLHINNLLGNL